MISASLIAAVPGVYKQFAESNIWGLLAPEILVATLSLVTLADGLLIGRRTASWYTPTMVKGFLLLLAGFTGWNAISGHSVDGISFGGLVAQQGWFTDAARCFFLLTAFSVTSLAENYLKRRKLGRHEFHHLVLVATAAMMLLVQSNHFVLFFLSLETVAVTLYILVGYDRENAFSLEAGVKYLISGGLSSALLLAGIVLLHGAASNTTLNPYAAHLDMFRFDHLQLFLAQGSVNHLPVVLAGIALVLAGVAFKIGAFPFNVWIPDVYQGAPSPATAFLAVGSKGAGVFALLVLAVAPGAPFFHIPGTIVAILAPVAGMTLLFGNIAALGQTNVKRLMGLSGISHAGFLLLGVTAALASPANAYFALCAVVAYLFVYLLSSTLVFAVIGRVAPDDETGHHIHDYRRLYARNPVLAGLLATGVGSLAGIPPTLGFVTKLLILVAAFKAGLFGLFGIALACVVAGVYYYFTWIREAFHRSKENDPVVPVALGGLARVMLTLVAAILVFGFLAQLLCCAH